MVVKPSQEDLVRRQSEKVINCLALLAQTVQFGMELNIDLTQKTPSDNLPDKSENEMLTTLSEIVGADVDN